MKRFFLIIFLIIFLFTGCSADKKSNNNLELIKSSGNYIKSVWLCYFELSVLTLNHSEDEFINSFNSLVNKIKSFGFNTITVQVKPCCDAFYKSSYFPSSKYCFGEEGSEMPYDPLKIMCEIALNNNIKLEAWLNPYRVSQSNDINSLCDSSIAKQWYNDENKRNNVYIGKKGIYFNPASDDVKELIVNGVKELVTNYNIYSIHFDDYFYPTKDKSIDEKEYNFFVNNGGNLNFDYWRRENVNTMIKSVYSTIKSIDENVKFGISPSGNITHNYNSLYADVRLWASSNEYVDYICPQIYYGFLNESQPFMKIVKEWVSFTKVDLYIGLPLYKCGKIDKYASKNNHTIQNEFIDNHNIIARQVNYISKFDSINGFYIFSYNSLFDENNKQELDELNKIMQSSSQD